MQPTTLTTGDRCPECGSVDIEPREPSVRAHSAGVWLCSVCGSAFYRYRRVLDPGNLDGSGWTLPPISGGAPASWNLASLSGFQPFELRTPMSDWPPTFVEELVCFGADVIRGAQSTIRRTRSTRVQSRALRSQRRAGRPLSV